MEHNVKTAGFIRRNFCENEVSVCVLTMSLPSLSFALIRCGQFNIQGTSLAKRIQTDLSSLVASVDPYLASTRAGRRQQLVLLLNELGLARW
jgi:hypothetical protein